MALSNQSKLMASFTLPVWLFIVSACAARNSALEPGIPHLLQVPLDTPPPQDRSSALHCLEVVPPVVTPTEDFACSQILMNHSFGNSYGKPFIGLYSPPRCEFNRVIINLTVEAAGRQFDRLACLYLNDTEVWRTSTAEPSASGIIWSYAKDVTAFLSLWKQPQTIIFDLGNLVNDVYTAPFNATLEAKFFTIKRDDRPPPADLILPISAQRSSTGEPSAFRVPDSRAISQLKFPKGIKRAVFTFAACGQMAEEFWWSNVPDSTKSTFGNGTELLAHSPFREVQLLIDGQLAGVAWPFPVIFTGGVAPGFWRPVVGIDAFDLKEYEIDLTPWAPLLSRGDEHSFEIRVVGLKDDGFGNAVLSSVGSYWVVTGKVFLWLDSTSASGFHPMVTAPKPDIFITSSTDRANSTLNYEVVVSREVQILQSSFDEPGHNVLTWNQRLTYSNVGRLSNHGESQSTTMMVSGFEWSQISNYDVSKTPYQRKFMFPLQINTEFAEDRKSKGFSIDASLDFSKNERVIGSSVLTSPVDAFDLDNSFHGWAIINRQNGSAKYFTDGKKSGSSGATEQDFVLKGINVHGEARQEELGHLGGDELYSRHVLAVNNSLVVDSRGSKDLYAASGAGLSEFAPFPREQVLGGKIMKLQSP